jgi:hypothetical protein
MTPVASESRSHGWDTLFKPNEQLKNKFESPFLIREVTNAFEEDSSQTISDMSNSDNSQITEESKVISMENSARSELRT